MENIKILKDTAEKEAKELLSEKQELVRQANAIRERIQKIEIKVISISGEITGYNKILSPKEKEDAE